MNARRTTSILSLIGAILGAVLLAAPAARAQSTVSTSTTTVSGSVTSTSTTTTTTTSLAGTTSPESISCSGPIKVNTTAVTDPVLPPSVVVFVDARSLSCVGQTSGATYLNNGQANLTRPLVASDVIKTSFAVFKTGTGYLNARTGLLTLNLSYNTTTGALLSVSGSVSGL